MADCRPTISGRTGPATAFPDQPDGIAPESSDLPDSKRAAERIQEYIAEFGDGLYDELNGKPLYGRDLDVVTTFVLDAVGGPA